MRIKGIGGSVNPQSHTTCGIYIANLTLQCVRQANVTIQILNSSYIYLEAIPSNFNRTYFQYTCLGSQNRHIEKK